MWMERLDFLGACVTLKLVLKPKRIFLLKLTKMVSLMAPAQSKTSKFDHYFFNSGIEGLEIKVTAHNPKTGSVCLTYRNPVVNDHGNETVVLMMNKNGTSFP